MVRAKKIPRLLNHLCPYDLMLGYDFPSPITYTSNTDTYLAQSDQLWLISISRAPYFRLISCSKIKELRLLINFANKFRLTPLNYAHLPLTPLYFAQLLIKWFSRVNLLCNYFLHLATSAAAAAVDPAAPTTSADATSPQRLQRLHNSNIISVAHAAAAAAVNTEQLQQPRN